MTLSPVQFAKEWEKTRSRALSSPSGDVRLLVLAEFYPLLGAFSGDNTYQPYFDEFRSLVYPLLTEEVLSDLSPDEIHLVVELVAGITGGDEVSRAHYTRTVTFAARVNFYVGELQSGLRFAAIAAKTEVPPLELDDLKDASPFDALRLLIDRLGTDRQELALCLKSIFSDWQSEIESVSNESVYCLLVEKDGYSSQPRGRLRLLSGSVAGSSKRSSTDKVTFHNEIVSPNDPMIGGAYNALEAVRRLYRRHAATSSVPDHLDAEFRFIATDRKFTGDSLGIALGLIAFAQLAKEDARRVQHSMSFEAALTGTLDSEGAVGAVNEESLALKIRRAFFSHLRYVVTPETNLEAARETCNSLRKQYHCRQLRIIPVARLEDVVTDHNVVRSAKLCIGEWMGKQVGKYSRRASVQVPLLLLLGYLLLSLLYAKLWIGFDWNPASLVIAGTSVEAVNSKGQSLWKHEFGYEMYSDSAQYVIGNLDDDKDQEIVYTPRTDDTTPLTGRVFVFDDDGSLLFKGECWIPRVYPTDTTAEDVLYEFPRPTPYLCDYNGKPLIVTILNDIYPARMYVKFWSPQGKMIGWFIGSGTGSLRWAEDFDADSSDDFFFVSFNNRMKCQSLFVVSPESLSGVTPPYTSVDIDLRNMPRLPMKYAVYFIPSPINAIEAISDYQPSGVVSRLDSCLYDFQTSEGYPIPLNVDYLLDCRFRVKEVQFSDPYAKKFAEYSAIGKLPRVSRDDWADSVRNLVTYYRDGTLVTERELRALEVSNSLDLR